jgi:hypothetical protein
MLQDAIKARLPIISVMTDDPVNAEEVLTAHSGGKKVRGFADLGEKGVVMQAVYWTFDEKHATLHNYHRFKHALATLIVFNPAKPSNLLFNAGVMPAPADMLYDMLSFAKDETRERLAHVLKGLSLKTAGEVIALTVARTGGTAAHEVRKTRLALTGGVQGLIPLECDEDEFYVWPPELREWADTNRKFFESPSTPHKLMPRGLMLVGAPGTGKTAASRAIAHAWGLPLYRLDIAQALGRWIGESENRVVQGLALAVQEAPCVLLMDEIEKIFSHNDDAGTITRILSGLLWWLSEHRSCIITIATTNNLSKIPPELYRAGRLDAVLTLPKLSLKEAKAFCLDVFKDVAGITATMPVQARLLEAVESAGKGELAHAEVSEIVYDAIKRNDWIKL